MRDGGVCSDETPIGGPRFEAEGVDAVLGWPRPIIRPIGSDRKKKLTSLRAMLDGVLTDETAVFMDEVDVKLNPKVGCV